jgi:hypothetical protein
MSADDDTTDAPPPAPPPPQPSSPWLRDVDAARRKLLGEAEALSSKLASGAEKELTRAQERARALRAEAADLASMSAQSAETLSLLARERAESRLKGGGDDLVRWQAAVVRSVEDRVFAEFDAFVVELEPKLRESGRQAARAGFGLLDDAPPTRDVIAEKRREGEKDASMRLERFERVVVKPMMKPIKAGMIDGLIEETPRILAGLAAYGLACGMIGAWVGQRVRGGGGDGGGDRR